MVRVAIPGGLWSDGAQNDGPQRQLELRPVSGEDELFLLETADLTTPSERATTLLARCLGESSNVEAIVRALTVGDREALLLHLRRLTLGETLECVLPCPAAACGEQIEIELRVADLLVPQYDDVRRAYDLVVDAEGVEYKLSFRLPTAADLDAVAMISRTDPERGANALLNECLASATRDGAEVRQEALLPSMRSAVGAAMAQHDPQAEIELDLTCPSCGGAFSVVFDTAMFFLQELDQRGSQLLHEVHTLAWHYHWSEREILEMSRRRRGRYLDLVGDAATHTRIR